MTQKEKGKKEVHKAYIVLYTCATSRMVHLDLVPDLTTESFIRSLQRLIARRGYPKLIVSDNGKTFKGRKLKVFCATRGIKWRFNLAKAPWWGGLFERMIRSTKRCLVKAIGRSTLSYEELLTYLVEVEGMLNSRPITYVYEDDHAVPLTPSHLYGGRRVLDNVRFTGDTLSDDEDYVIDRESIIDHARKLNRIVEHFWVRWHKEYLGDLREVHKIATQILQWEMSL